MNYRIVSYIVCAKNKVILRRNNWDDFGYKTSFDVFYANDKGEVEEIGGLRIAKEGMEKGSVSSHIPDEFEKIPDEFYSLWDSADSYLKARKLMERHGFNIFSDLNDIAYDLERLKRHKSEPAFQNSLLRFVSMHTCVNQFHRISHGEAMLTPYSFEYSVENPNKFVSKFKIDFNVIPQSYPPTNVHALIGSNGTGKTSLIKDMIKSICKKESKGRFIYSDGTNGDYGYFESVMCISFSPFDDYSEIEKYEEVSFIGFKKQYDKGGSLLESIEADFADSFFECFENRSVKRDLMESLNYIVEVGEFTTQASLFREMLNKEKLNDEDKNEIKSEFGKMSAGHKVTLSIITRCIANLAEKTIVFIDEPENHLHPPLLSTLIRSLSKILNKRNGVGIISTHSPIILQEIPRLCVWNLYRVNDSLFSERVENETFGTNIGVLTNSVFDFEITRTGFNSYLMEVVESSDSYDDVLEKFSYQLGDQAKAMVRILLARKGVKG